LKSYFYGVSLDGLLLKVAEFDLQGNRLSLLRLESMKLNRSLTSGFSEDDAGSGMLRTESVDIEMSVGGGEIDIDKLDVDADSPPKQVIESAGESKAKPMTDFRHDAAFQFLSKFNLNTGKVSISCSELKCQWKLIRSDKKLDLKAIRKLALPSDQLKDPGINCDFIPAPDGAYNAIVHTGGFELMGLLNDSCQVVYGNKRPPFYHFIEPNEVSMLNIFNLFYSKEESKYTTFLYLGDDLRLGLVIKDRKIVKSFTIMIYDQDPQKVRETVYAKLMLEHEISSFPIIENIVLAGSYATEDDITYYNARTRFRHQLFKMNASELNKYKVNFRMSSSVKPEAIPAFIIPIAMGLKSALAGKKGICKFNLIPKNILESRKLIKISWHSVFFMLLIVGAIYYGRDMMHEKNQELSRLKSRHERLRDELTFLQNFESMMQGFQDQIAQKQELYLRGATISAEKNTWNEIIQTLSDFVNRNPLIWIEQVTSQGDRFSTRGRSYHRDRITNFSRIFTDGHITRIAETEIAGHLLWEFEVTFLRPPGAETSAMVFPPHLQSYENFYHNHQLLVQRQLELAQFNQGVTSTGFIDTSTPTPTTEAEESLLVYEMARTHYLSNNFNDAITLLEQYIARYRNGAEIANANYTLGEIYFVINSFERAIPYFLEVIRLQRELLPDAMFFAARSYEILGNYENAVRYYTMLTQRFPNHPFSTTARENLQLLREGF